MSDSVYRVMEVIGSSSESWEKAARNAVDKAGIHREDLRIAEAVEFDMKIEGKQVVAYRTGYTPPPVARKRRGPEREGEDG